MEAYRLEHERENEERRREQFNWKWNDVCPRLYRQTDRARLDQTLLALVESWEPKKLLASGEQKIGLLFYGESGSMKTRLAYWALRCRLLEEDTCYAVNGVDFAACCRDQFNTHYETQRDATAVLNECRSAQILLFDDLGKERETERVEMELYRLVESRTNKCVPTIWTTNATPRALRARYSVDRGEPILRRIQEFARVIRCCKPPQPKHVPN